MARVGIDLGTTFSVISYYDVDARRVEVIPDEESTQLTIPSAVYYPESGDPIAGWMAMNLAVSEPDRLVRWIKMSMGTDYKKNIGDVEYSPEEVSAEILKKLKKNAEAYLNEEVESAVITVPAYFNDTARYATEEAAKLAGLEVTRLLAEPSAAALAYTIEADLDLLSGEKHVLVTDLGGGTYDVTLLKTLPRNAGQENPTLDIKIICKEGSQELGGKLWDDALEEEVVKECIAQGHTDDPKSEPRLALMLRENVIKGKEMLSNVESADIVCDMGNTQKITREGFEDLTASLMLQVETKLRTVLELAEKDQGVGIDDIDTILLVGGSSKMPMVPQMIQNVTGKEPGSHRSLDLLVAMGAAYDVCIASGEPVETRQGGIQIVTPPVDIARMAVGVKAVDTNTNQNVNAIIINDGSPFQEEFTRDDFITQDDKQGAIDFEIYEGNDRDIDSCQYLATATLSLPPDQPKGMQVKVTLKYNENGVIVGTGVCFTTEGQKEVPIEVDRSQLMKG